MMAQRFMGLVGAKNLKKKSALRVFVPILDLVIFGIGNLWY